MNPWAFLTPSAQGFTQRPAATKGTCVFVCVFVCVCSCTCASVKWLWVESLQVWMRGELARPRLSEWLPCDKWPRVLAPVCSLLCVPFCFCANVCVSVCCLLMPPHKCGLLVRLCVCVRVCTHVCACVHTRVCVCPVGVAAVWWQLLCTLHCLLRRPLRCPLLRAHTHKHTHTHTHTYRKNTLFSPPLLPSSPFHSRGSSPGLPAQSRPPCSEIRTGRTAQQ